MESDITKFSAFKIAKLLSKKKIDPVALVDIFFENFKKASVDTKYAVCKELRQDALIEAEDSWKRQKNNTRLSFFDGIPSGWKDIIDIKNYPAYGGSKLLKSIRKNIEVKDATIVTNARKKGIIPLFKTSTVEFAFGGLGINSSKKYPPNQMIKEHFCPGGSSSGSAAAVYSNLVPLAVGSDTAGSIRIPSCWHSLVGFKPTFNNISCRGILPLSKSYDTLGTICKSVKDTQIFYNILSNTVFDLSKKNKIYTIGIVDNFVKPDLLEKDKIIFESFLNNLEERKLHTKRINIPEFYLVNKIIEEEGGIVNYEAWNFWKDIIKKDTTLIDKNVLSRFELGKQMSKNTFLKIKKKIYELKNKINNYFDEIDFLLFPTLNIKPPKIKDVINKRGYAYHNNLVLSNTRIANLFNLPAITLPIKNNYWLSFTICAKEKDDESLLNIALQLENIKYN